MTKPPFDLWHFLICAAAVAGQRIQLSIFAAPPLWTVACSCSFHCTSNGILLSTLAFIFTAVHCIVAPGPPKTGRMIVEHVTPQQDHWNVKNTGIEVIEKVKKRYIMERMTSGLIRCLGKSRVAMVELRKAESTKNDAVVNIRPL